MKEELKEILHKVVGSRGKYPEIPNDTFYEFWADKIIRLGKGEK